MRVPRPAQRFPRNPATRADLARGDPGHGAEGHEPLRAGKPPADLTVTTDPHALATRPGTRRRFATAGTVRPGRSGGSLALASLVALVGWFLATAGLGSTNGTVAGVGAGIGITGLVYAGHTLRRRRRASRVAGTAHVVTVTPPPSGSTHGRCEMHLIVQATRLVPTAVRHRDNAVPAAKWPVPGSRLPVAVDPGNPRELRIIWSRVRPHAEPPRRRRPRVDHLSEAPAGAPGQEELATLADAAEFGTTSEGSAGQDDTGSSWRQDAGVAEPPSDPIDFSLLDAMSSPPPSDNDRLLEEYGSPIREVGVTLIVSDLRRSLEFYRDLLGFFEIETGPDMVLLEARTGRLVLRQRDDTQAAPPRLMHLTLEVNDLDTAYRNLSRKGVEFIDEPRTVLRGELLELWAVSFHDPDGHGVALTCWRPRDTEEATG